MGNNKKEPLDISDLSASLPAAAAALNAEDRAGLVNALKHKLQNLAGEHTDVLESLTPAVRKRVRVEVLIDIQREHDELEAKFFEERAALEAKYQKLYEPLYSKRYDIVNGVVEVDGVKNEDAMDQTDDKAGEEKGVPNFWLTAMKTPEILAEEISERDEEALKYLKDIKWNRMDDPNVFKLEFFFDTNPFFKNSVLTKVYHMIDDDEPIIEKAIGTDIEWLPGKCLTQKILKKKPKKGSKNAKPITKTENCESFFNFFSPPEVPENEDDIDEELAEELQNQMEQDYDIGRTIRDKIIPYAVLWFKANELFPNNWVFKANGFFRTTGSSRQTGGEPDSSRAARATDASPGALRDSPTDQKRSTSRNAAATAPTNNIKNFESTLKGIEGMHF